MERQFLTTAYTTVFVKIAFGSEAAKMADKHAEDQQVIFLPNHADDVLRAIGGQALVRAKQDGVQWALWGKYEPAELQVRLTEDELLDDKVTHERLLELMAAFDVIGQPDFSSNAHGEWLFVTLRMDDDALYTFYGLGTRNDGKVEREMWRFFKAYLSHDPADNLTYPHPQAMQIVIDRRREIETWEDPSTSDTRRMDTLLEIAGDDEEDALLLDEEFDDWDDEE